jgi:hypothetical protein
MGLDTSKQDDNYVKYAIDFVPLAKEGTMLQGMTDQLNVNEIGGFFGLQINVKI